jgi:hypothetical protein
MFLSWLPVMMRSPSGSHTAEVTSAECCLTTSMQDPFAMFHILSDPSLPAKNTWRLSKCHSQAMP